MVEGIQPETTATELAYTLPQLESFYLDIAGDQGHLQPDTIQYIKDGGSIRLCLADIEQQAGCGIFFVDVIFIRQVVAIAHQGNHQC